VTAFPPATPCLPPPWRPRSLQAERISWPIPRSWTIWTSSVPRMGMER
jgi:hypothetical protein